MLSVGVGGRSETNKHGNLRSPFLVAVAFVVGFVLFEGREEIIVRLSVEYIFSKTNRLFYAPLSE